VDAATRISCALLEGYSRSSDPSKIPDVETGKASAKLEKPQSQRRLPVLMPVSRPGPLSRYWRSDWLRSRHPGRSCSWRPGAYRCGDQSAVQTVTGAEWFTSESVRRHAGAWHWTRRYARPTAGPRTWPGPASRRM